MFVPFTHSTNFAACGIVTLSMLLKVVAFKKLVAVHLG